MPPKGSRINHAGKDPIWTEVIATSTGKTNPVVTCNHCSRQWTSSAPTRIRDHLRVCPQLPDRLWDEFQPEKRNPKPFSTPETVTVSRKRKTMRNANADAIDEDEQDILDRECAEWIFAAGLPLNTVEHPLFKKFVKSLKPGYEPPPSWRLGNSINLASQRGLGWTIADILSGQTDDADSHL